MSGKSELGSTSDFRLSVVPEEEIFDPVDLVYDKGLYFVKGSADASGEDSFGEERFYITPRHLDDLISSFKKATKLYEDVVGDDSFEGDWLEPIPPVGDEVTYSLSGVGTYGFQINYYDHGDWKQSFTIQWYFPREITAALILAKRKLE